MKCILKRKIAGILPLIAVLVLTACSSGGNFNAIIDWVDFVMLENIQYTGVHSGSGQLEDSSVEAAIGEVKFNVSENVHDPGYKLKNGDAAFLTKGTKLHKIKGYRTEFRIAANVDGKWRIYEADSNPNAVKGSDLLDIGGKVSYIGINSETDGITELGAIKDEAVIGKLVAMVLEAQVDQNNQDHKGDRYFISFHLSDGTDVTRCYWMGTGKGLGELSRGIMLPGEFGDEIKKCLNLTE